MTRHPSWRRCGGLQHVMPGAASHSHSLTAAPLTKETSPECQHRGWGLTDTPTCPSCPTQCSAVPSTGKVATNQIREVVLVSCPAGTCV